MLAWTDVESTGLDERNGHLLEVALILTDDNLVELAATSVVVQPVGTTIDAAMANADPIVQEMHKVNGLAEEIRAGKGMRRHEAEAKLVDWVQSVVGENLALDGAPEITVSKALAYTPLAGSTVGFDRRWLREHMPKLEALFSYRSVDVSSFTEMAKRWNPKVYEGRPKAGAAHRALADTRESIAYLRYYRESGFVARGEHSR